LKQKTGEKRPPRAIAEALKSKLESIDFVQRVEVAGAGYSTSSSIARCCCGT